MVVPGYDACVAIKVKICGVRSPEDAAMVAAAGADFVGIVHVPGTSRHVAVADARQIALTAREAGKGGTRSVLLFRDMPPNFAAEIAFAAKVDLVQLHGKEGPEFAEQMPKSVEIFKVFRVDDTLAERLSEWAAVSRLAAIILEPPQATGGTGLAHDLPALNRVMAAVNWPAKVGLMLAGGLTPENVGAAIAAVKPLAVWGVDVSSGVEASPPGPKSAELVLRFIAAAR